MSKEYIADKATLDSVNTKVGASGDSGSASVFAKLNGIANTLANHVAAWTAARANNLDTTISSRAPANTALSNGVWTNTRAGYLDYLANGTYGLNAIKSEVTAVKNAAGGSSVRKITRGLIATNSIPVSSTYSEHIIATISTIDSSKCFLLTTGLYGRGSSYWNYNVLYLKIISSAQIQLILRQEGYRSPADTAPWCPLSWEIVEMI